MLDFRVDSFLAVCKYMNYTKAAQELNLTQPAITQHIQYLQSYYNVKFFSRDNNQLILTPEGEMFKNVMTTICQDLKKVSDDLISLQNERYHLRFGVLPSIVEHGFDSQLVDYIKNNRNRNVHLVVNSSGELMKALDNGEIHFAITDEFINAEGYKYLPWSVARCICICSSSHEMAAEAITLEDLRTECILVHSSFEDPACAINSYMRTKGNRITDFDRFIKTDNFTIFRQLLLNDCGIAFVPELLFAEELKSGTMKEIPLTNFDLKCRYIFIWRKDSVNEDLFLLMYDKLKGLPEGQTKLHPSDIEFT